MIRLFVVIAAFVAGTLVGVAPADAIIAPDTRCRSGSVSITFDDGPHRTFTPKLLRVLRANHAQATFFVQGRNAKRYPELLRAEIADGHAVENHSWDHPQLTRLSSAKVGSQIARTTSAIRRATGIRPTLVRPPYGDTNARVRKVFRQRQLKQSLWTIDTND